MGDSCVMAAVATATKPAQSNAAASGATPVSPSAGPTGGEAVSTGTNEIDAMRNAALALHKQGPAGAGITQAAGLSLPQVVPTLKLREPGLQQVCLPQLCAAHVVLSIAL